MPCALRYSLTCWLDLFVPFDSTRAEPLVGTVLFLTSLTLSWSAGRNALLS